MKIMKRAAALLCALCAVTALLPPGPALASERIVYYVAPNGSDAGKGTIDSPLATIEGARNKLRREQLKDIAGAQVIFRGGEYRFSSTAVFGSDDSGLESSPIVYQAMDGEKVVFKASVELTNPTLMQVTDERILRRIKEKVRNKIVAIDLSPYITQAQLKDNSKINATMHTFNGGEPNQIFVDDIMQTLSEWPNGDAAYTHWIDSEDGRTITFEGTNPIYWTEAKDWWIGGYQDWDWRYSRLQGIAVDPVKKTITVSDDDPSNFRFTSYQSRRWKAFNLLEEIDLPGEYYIDRENMTLYLYPPYSLNNSKIELSLANTGFLNLNGTQNITFRNIEFTQCTGDAVYMCDVKNIDFIGCAFKYIGARGIVTEGSKTAITDKDYWQVQKLDGSYDCDIKDSIFYEIGSSAVDMSGGNVDTLKPSNNVIENNFFYMCSQTVKGYNAVQLYGCGHKFIHNNMSRCAYQGVLYRGNDMEIMYNEMYDCIQETDDCGVVYAGRNSLQRGGVTAYNYIHDSGSTEQLVFGHQCGVYWDDQMCGQEAYKNIIQNVNKNVYTNGVDNVYKNNTSIGIKVGSMDIKNGGMATNNQNEGMTKFGSIIANPTLYYEKYKNLEAMLKIVASSSNANPELAKFNVVTGNLDVDSAGIIIGSNTVEYGEYKNNIQMETCDDFVDPINRDYRIKSGSDTAKRMPELLNDTFDIEQIGMQTDIVLNKETASFKQLYPENGATAVAATELEFKWQEAFGASKYRLVIATDNEMKNVVYDEIADYSVQKVDSLKKNTVYYWKVYAINRSREFASEWESSSPVYVFSTALYEKLNTDYFNNVVDIVKKKAQTIEEGVKPGEYKLGTKAELEDTIKRAEILSRLKLGAFPQVKFDAIAEDIGSFFNKRNKVNKGVIDFGDYIEQPELWIGVHKHDGKEVSLLPDPESKDVLAMTGINNLGHLTGSVIYSFDAVFDVSTGFLDIGINSNITGPQWVSSNIGYSLVIKPDCIELQRTNGSNNTLLLTVDYKADDLWHKFDYGWIDIGIGNVIILYIDDKPVIEYQDVTGEAAYSLCNFCMLLYNNTENQIRLRRAENIMTAEKFNEIVRKNTYQSAKTLLDGIRSDYNKREPFVIIKKNAKKVINEEKVVDLSAEPLKTMNGAYMLPVSRLSDILLAEVTESNGTYNVLWNGKSAVISQSDCSEIDGVLMVSAEELLNKLGRNYVKEDNLGLLIVGNIVTMNNVQILTNISNLIGLMEEMGECSDITYAELLPTKEASEN